MTIREFFNVYAEGKSKARRIFDAILFFVFIDLFIYAVVSVVMLVLWVS
ncbi:MAG: hypothetical protein ABI763_04325 [Bacteroidota bacterium]